MKTKEEFRKEVAEQFANVLNEENYSWIKEWHSTAIPISAVSGREYRGVNRFFLSIIAMSKGYKDPRWMTFNQIRKINEKAHVRKGEHAADVEYWFVMDKTKKRGDKNKYISFGEANRLIRMEGRDSMEFQPVARYFKVFNAEQVEGITPMQIVEPDRPEINQAELVDILSKNMHVTITNDGGDNAFYSPSEDAIHLPEKNAFNTEYAYNATALHELAHSTGHSSRLNRNIKNIFGSSDYAFEELIAEMTSCFMALETVPPESLNEESLAKYTENHKAYIQSWIQAIKDKPDVLFHAIKNAEKAADYMDMKAGLMTELEYNRRYSEKAEAVVEEVPALIVEKPLTPVLPGNDLVPAKAPRKLKM